MNNQQIEIIKRLLHFCHLHTVPKGTRIIKPGEIGNTLYYVMEGSASVMTTDVTGHHQLILSYLYKGDFIGEMGVFIGETVRDVTVVARERSLLAKISYERLHTLLKTNLADSSVEIMVIIGQVVAHRLLTTRRKVASLAFMTATGRIWSTLQELAKEPSAMTHPLGIQIKITRQELGQITGCSREMAGKILKVLQEEDRITCYGKQIIILDQGQ